MKIKAIEDEIPDCRVCSGPLQGFEIPIGVCTDCIQKPAKRIITVGNIGYGRKIGD